MTWRTCWNINIKHTNNKTENESGGGYESVVVFFADYAFRAMFHKKTVARKDNNKRSRRTIEEKR